MGEPTAFQSRLVEVANQQFDEYAAYVETEEPLTSQIIRYWTELGFEFESVQTPWSAVFVSWCVKEAGATIDQFQFAYRHSEFVQRAIEDADAETGVFRGREITAYAPKIGDILQNNRHRHLYDFAYARAHSAYESHSAVVVEVVYSAELPHLITIGGNERNSVRQSEVPLTSEGYVDDGAGRYICVVETLL